MVAGFLCCVESVVFASIEVSNWKPVNAGIQNIDVLDLKADALIYSTNVILTCSGGVGACLVKRYGRHVQDDLHGLLRDQDIKFADQGSVFQLVSSGMAYSKGFHTIPCDGFYNTTPEIVTEILGRCLRECVASPAIRSVALSALATGYGRMGYDEFFRVASSVLADSEFASLDSVTLCIYDPYSYSLAREQISEESLNLTAA